MIESGKHADNMAEKAPALRLASRAAAGRAVSPLWRDLRGRSAYRMISAATLDELCAGSGLKIADLLRRLRRELRRPLSRQTLAAWRRGDQPIPNEVMMALAVVVKRGAADARIACSLRALADAEADPDFVALVNRYYLHDSVRTSGSARS
jgi:hypothetical protein